jgi:hypothetical protein
VLNLRNKAVAHSDYDARPVTRLGYNGSGFGVTFVPVRQLLNEFDLEGFQLLVSKVQRLCRGKLHELDAQIRKAE